MQTYHLFISHSWHYAHTHDNLVRLLNAQPGFTAHAECAWNTSSIVTAIRLQTAV